MAMNIEELAQKFVPRLFFIKTNKSVDNIKPEYYRGIYWRSVKSAEKWADLCIQYILFFDRQELAPDLAGTFLGKFLMTHFNDYAPIFLYLKNETPVRVVFDICHYEAVGKIDCPSPLLPKNEGPQFQVWKFYRGILPVRDARQYEPLTKRLAPLNPHRLNEWWKGLTIEGDYKKEAKFVIIKKLKRPFQEIVTFRDSESVFGLLIDAFFKAKRIGEDVLCEIVYKTYGDSSRYEIRKQSGGFQILVKRDEIPVIVRKGEYGGSSIRGGSLFSSRLQAFSGHSYSGGSLANKYKRKDRSNVLDFSFKVSPFTVDSVLGEKAHDMNLPNGEKLSEQDIKEFIEFMENDILGEPRIREHLVR